MDRRTYDDAALTAAVAASRSWRGVLRHLGLKATSAAAVRSVKRHVERLELDTSHFTGQRRWSELDLTEAIAASRSWAQVAITLGLSGGSSTTLLKGHAARLGIDVRHFAPASATPPPDLVSLVASPAHLARAGSCLAAGWFLLCGYDVSWPLEPCRYDLLAVRNEECLRIQVKTTRSMREGAWMVTLSSHGGLMTYAPDEIDYFFIVDGDLEQYLIPVATVGGRHAISLSAYSQFRIARELTGAADRSAHLR